MVDKTKTIVQQAAPAGQCIKCGVHIVETANIDRDFCPECMETAPLPLSHYYMTHYYGSFAD